MSKLVVVHTDGACCGNPGPGGWASLLEYENSKGEIFDRTLRGGHTQTTNNRMELQAIIEALKVLDRPCYVRIFSDSRYCVNGINVWRHAWKRKGWVKNNGEEPLNIDLWKEIDTLCEYHECIEVKHVRAHTGHPKNEYVDDEARKQSHHYCHLKEPDLEYEMEIAQTLEVPRG